MLFIISLRPQLSDGILEIENITQISPQKSCYLVLFLSNYKAKIHYWKFNKNKRKEI